MRDVELPMSDSQRKRNQPETIPFFFGNFRAPILPASLVRALALTGALVLLCGPACATPEGSFFTTREANERITLGFFLKDNECGTTHAITVPILAPARMQDVDTCVIGILDTDCTEWAEDDPTPDECRSLQISLIQ